MAIEFRKLEERERALDYIAGEMDAIAGFPVTPRLAPRARPVVLAGNTVLNNIRIANSQIGVLNTGTIGSIDNAIGLVRRDGSKEMAEALKALTEAVATSRDLGDDKRDSALELVSAIASEAATPPDRRRTSVARALVVDLASVLGGVAATVQLWASYGPAIKAFFHLP